MVADVTKALDNHTLSSQTGRQVCRLDIFCVAEELLHGVLHSTSGCFGSALNATHLWRFSGDTGGRIDIFGMQRPVDISHQSHLSLPCSHVRGRHVQSWAEITFFLELQCKPASNGIKVFTTVGARVDAKPSFGTAKGNIDHSAFKGHQGGQSFDLVLVDCGGKTDAALGRQAVFAMGRAPAFKNFVFTIYFRLKTHLVNGTTFPKQLSNSRGQIHPCYSEVIHSFNTVHETMRLTGRHNFLH